MAFGSEPPPGRRSEPTDRVHVDPLFRHSATRPCERNRGTLLVLAGPSAGEVATFDAGPATIGRAPDCELCVDDSAVSRYHAVCYRTDQGFVLEDLGSANGTWIAGRRLHRRAALEDGTRFLVGTTVLSFRTHDLFEQQATRRMRDHSLRDGLTRLWNRRYLDRRLREELSYASRHRCPLALVLLDLDRFKEVNDRHGHQVGDAVLQEVAGRIRRAVRPEDVVARYGGEELVVLSRGLEPLDALAAAERLRAIVAQSPFEGPDGPLRVSVSAGVSWTDGRDGVGRRELIARADQALYRAKDRGRNRVVGFEDAGG